MKILVPTDLSEVSLEAVEFIMQNEQLNRENHPLFLDPFLPFRRIK